MLLSNKVGCLKCKHEINISNFNKHYKSCDGTGLKSRKVKKKNFTQSLRQIGDLYECPICGILKTKKGISSHIIFKHENGGKQKHTEETKQKIKEKRQFQVYTDLTRKKISDGLKKFNRENPEVRKSAVTENTRRKIAIKLVGNKNHKHTSGKKIEYKNYLLRSSWELAVAKYFDDNDIIWTYEEKYFKLSEVSSYTPDFFLYDKDGNLIKLIEVKGYLKEEFKEKFASFKKLYPELEIEMWQKKELDNLNIKVY